MSDQKREERHRSNVILGYIEREGHAQEAYRTTDARPSERAEKERTKVYHVSISMTHLTGRPLCRPIEENEKKADSKQQQSNRCATYSQPIHQADHTTQP